MSVGTSVAWGAVGVAGKREGSPPDEVGLAIAEGTVADTEVSRVDVAWTALLTVP